MVNNLIQYPPSIPDPTHAQVQYQQSDRGHLQHVGYPSLYPTAPPPPPDYRGRLSWELISGLPGYEAVLSQLQAGMCAVSSSEMAVVSEACQLNLVETPRDAFLNGDLTQGAYSPLAHHAQYGLAAQESQVRTPQMRHCC